MLYMCNNEHQNILFFEKQNLLTLKNFLSCHQHVLKRVLLEGKFDFHDFKISKKLFFYTEKKTAGCFWSMYVDVHKNKGPILNVKGEPWVEFMSKIPSSVHKKPLFSHVFGRFTRVF
jgi:hypothetical protein